MYAFRRVQAIPRPIDEVFAFFTDVQHLARIAPSFLKLGWVTDPTRPIAEGALIDYRVRMYGVPFRWRTRIVAYEPPRAFAYEQARGPLRAWRHAYRLEPDGEGTRLIDEVTYDPGWGVLGRVAHHLLFRHSVRAMFDHRAARIRALLGA